MSGDISLDLLRGISMRQIARSEIRERVQLFAQKTLQLTAEERSSWLGQLHANIHIILGNIEESQLIKEVADAALRNCLHEQLSPQQAASTAKSMLADSLPPSAAISDQVMQEQAEYLAIDNLLAPMSLAGPETAYVSIQKKFGEYGITFNEKHAQHLIETIIESQYLPRIARKGSFQTDQEWQKALQSTEELQTFFTERIFGPNSPFKHLFEARRLQQTVLEKFQTIYSSVLPSIVQAAQDRLLTSTNRLLLQLQELHPHFSAICATERLRDWHPFALFWQKEIEQCIALCQKHLQKSQELMQRHPSFDEQRTLLRNLHDIEQTFVDTEAYFSQLQQLWRLAERSGFATFGPQYTMEALFGLLIERAPAQVRQALQKIQQQEQEENQSVAHLYHRVAPLLQTTKELVVEALQHGPSRKPEHPQSQLWRFINNYRFNDLEAKVLALLQRSDLQHGDRETLEALREAIAHTGDIINKFLLTCRPINKHASPRVQRYVQALHFLGHFSLARQEPRPLPK